MTLFQQSCQRLWKPFTFLCIIAFLYSHRFYGSTSPDPTADMDATYLSLSSLSSTSPQKHPIEFLVEHARRKATDIVERQSKSLQQAMANYRSRYYREPPPGFEDWYRVAVELNATIIDEYDTITAMFEPYWGISARELRKRVRDVLDPRQFDGKMLGVQVKDHHLSFINERTTIRGNHIPAYKDSMELFLQYLPDMEFAANPFDQPMVFAPYDAVSEAVQRCPLHQNDSNNPWEINPKSPQQLNFHYLGEQPTWEIAIQSCPLSSPSRSALFSQPPQKYSPEEESEQLLFTKNNSYNRNICESSEAANQYGIFVSPGSFWFTNHLVPVISRCKLSTSQDLTMPSPDYNSALMASYRPYDENEDMPWDQKQDRLYWVGGSSDGIYTKKNDDRWKRGQRYRAVQGLNNGSKPITLLRQDSDTGFWESYISTMKSLSKYIHVKFSKLDHCSDEVCKSIRDPKEGIAFTTEHEDYHTSYGSKLSLDVDGVTYTERFQRLLHSHNTVLKMTIFQEWHDDFLVPWVHYVPVTVGMKELPEMVRFFLETEKGREIAKTIAEDGRNWAQKTWRPVDMKLATWRVLLEYARIWGPERDRTGECPWDR